MSETRQLEMELEENFVNYEDYLYHIGWLSHKPREGYPREGHVGERVYSERWEALMQRMPRYGTEAPNGMLATILHQLPARITQRHAMICATVICWLGTNCGQSIRLQAKKYMSECFIHGEKAYLLAWAEENVRHSWLNHGFKIIEHMLAPTDHFGKDWLTGNLCGVTLQRRPELSVEDYETVESLMQWLGSGNGLSFANECEREIAAIYKVVRKTEQIGRKV